VPVAPINRRDRTNRIECKAGLGGGGVCRHDCDSIFNNQDSGLHPFSNEFTRAGLLLAPADAAPNFTSRRFTAAERTYSIVRHAMYKATVYDRVSRARVVDLDRYIGEDHALQPACETVLRAEQVNTEFVPIDRFREVAWQRDFEDRHFHASSRG